MSAWLSLLSLQRERSISRGVHRRQPHAGGSDGSRGEGYEQEAHRPHGPMGHRTAGVFAQEKLPN